MSKNRDLANLLADGSTVTTADMSADTVTSLKSGRKNLIINGDFHISQRGDYSTDTAVTNGEYALDRWKYLVSGVTANTRRDRNVTIDSELKNILHLQATSSASARLCHRHLIEANSNRTPIAGKQTIFSVWVKSNNANTGIHIYDYGAGGYVGTDTHSGNGQWEKLSVTFTGGTGTVTQNGSAIEINVGMQTVANGPVTITSGDYVDIAQPQLELGDTATDFEHRSYGEELALCQRYCYVLESSNTYYRFPVAIAHPSIDQTQGYQPFPTVMRVVPTLSTSYNDIQIANNGSGSATAVALSGDGDSQHGVNLRLDFPSGAITTHGRAIQYRIVNQTDWKFTFDAEL